MLNIGNGLLYQPVIKPIASATYHHHVDCERTAVDNIIQGSPYSMSEDSGGCIGAEHSGNGDISITAHYEGLALDDLAGKC